MQLVDNGAPAAVVEQLDKMVALQRQLCDAYNKLRSVAGNWEAESGVENPAFYPGNYEETGEPVVLGGKCRCGSATESLRRMTDKAGAGRRV